MLSSSFTHHVPFLISFSFSASTAASSSLSFVTWPQMLWSMGRSSGPEVKAWPWPCPFRKCDIISASWAWLIVPLLSLLARDTVGEHSSKDLWISKLRKVIGYIIEYVLVRQPSSGSKMDNDGGWTNSLKKLFFGLCCMSTCSKPDSLHWKSVQIKSIFKIQVGHENLRVRTADRNTDTHITNFHLQKKFSFLPIYRKNIKDIPNYDFQQRQMFTNAWWSHFSWVYTCSCLTWEILTHILSVDTRNQQVWGGGGRAVGHCSILSRRSFICRRDGADWRLVTQERDSLKLSDTQYVKTLSEPTFHWHHVDSGHAKERIYVCKTDNRFGTTLAANFHCCSATTL